MFDIKLLREEPDNVKENLKKKFQENLIPLVDKTLKLDTEWRKLKNDSDNLRAQRNKISAEINKAKKEGKSIDDIKKKAAQIPKDLEKIQTSQNKLFDEIKENLLLLPNMIDPSVKIGKDDSENTIIKTWGKPKQFDFELINHAELAEKLGVADFDRAAKTSGAGFYYLYGELALLNQALIRFAIDHLVKKGFTYTEPPLMLRREPYSGSVQMQDFEEVMYKIEDEDLYLIATSEHALMAQFHNEILPEEALPMKFAGYSMCFRKEVGAHGIDTKGLFRTHQFNKVEMFVFCKPEDSPKFYDEMLQASEELFQALELPYQVLELCSGDMTAVKAKSCDIEVWMPRQQKYCEVTSLTNCTDYQARRTNFRVEDKHKNKMFPHTLNNTAIATSRALVAILENYQNKDGTVTIPKALQPYMFGKKVILKKN